jgi:hypothetical protein
METSHVALLKYKTTSDPAEAFSFIDSPLYINTLVTSGSDAGGGGSGSGVAIGGDAGAGTPTGGSDSNARKAPWVGLGTVHGSSSGGGGASGRGGDTAGSSTPGGRGDGRSTTPPAVGSPSAGSSNPSAAGTNERAVDLKRTEFVIVMYWVEPLPTEPPEAKAQVAGAPAGGN